VKDAPEEPSPCSPVRPLAGELDLSAITHNIALLRAQAGRQVKIIAPIKANAYGHGVVAVSKHLESLGVEGLATANFDDAVAARGAGVKLPIIMYGSQLPSGVSQLVENGLTPSAYSREMLQALAVHARALGRRIPVHVKVDAGLGRLGVRLDETAAFAREVMASPGLHLEGIYTHIPFSDAAGAEWSSRRLRAFCSAVRAIETEHQIRIDYAQGAASSLLARQIPDELNTISPGHLVFGLCPLNGERAETLGFRKAMRAIRAQLIHIGERRKGDDLAGTGPEGLASDGRVGIILFGMDNGYRMGPTGKPGYVLCRGKRCPVLGVSAEYATIDLAAVADVRLGDVVTIVGRDGAEEIAAEDVAAQLGAPSAAYWMTGLRNVPVALVGQETAASA
jgi:alanine racemase